MHFQPHDYTILKFPERMHFSRLAVYNPFDIVLKDTERKILNHLEYFEMTRVTKVSTKLEYQRLTERINEMTDIKEEDIKYFLKIQLFLIAQSVNEEMRTKAVFIKQLLLAMNFYISLEQILAMPAKRTNEQLLVARNIGVTLTNLFKAENSGDHSAFVEKLKTNYQSLMEKAKELGSKSKKEMCELCDTEIMNGDLKCVQFHEVNRCCYTNLQVIYWIIYFILIYNVLISPLCRSPLCQHYPVLFVKYNHWMLQRLISSCALISNKWFVQRVTLLFNKCYLQNP